MGLEVARPELPNPGPHQSPSEVCDRPPVLLSLSVPAEGGEHGGQPQARTRSPVKRRSQCDMGTIASEHSACVDDDDAGAISTLTPEQRSLRASLAADVSWTNTVDRAARTAKAREANSQRFVTQARELHAGHDVSEEFIAEVAERLRRIEMKRMALASAKARRAKTAARMKAAHDGGA